MAHQPPVPLTRNAAGSEHDFSAAFESLASPASDPDAAARFHRNKTARPVSLALHDRVPGEQFAEDEEYDEAAHIKWLAQFQDEEDGGGAHHTLAPARAEQRFTPAVDREHYAHWYALIAIGEVVEHPRRGRGMVQSVDTTGDGSVVIVYDDGKTQNCDQTVWGALPRSPSSKLKEGHDYTSSGANPMVSGTIRLDEIDRQLAALGETHGVSPLARRARELKAAKLQTERRSVNVEMSEITKRARPKHTHIGPPRSTSSATTYAKDAYAYTPPTAKGGIALSATHGGWSVKRDPTNGRSFYSHAATGEVRWDAPKESHPFYDQLSLDYQKPTLPRLVVSGGGGTIVMRSQEKSSEIIVPCCEDPRCGGGGAGGGGSEGRCMSGGGDPDDMNESTSCGTAETVPHPKGHCLQCGCFLSRVCKRNFGIAWSVWNCILGAIIIARAFYLVAITIALIAVYAPLKDSSGQMNCRCTSRKEWWHWHNWRYDRINNVHRNVNQPWCWRKTFEEMKRYNINEFCHQMCCHEDSDWIIPLTYTQGPHYNSETFYTGNLRSALLLLIFGLLLVVFSLAHPKVRERAINTHLPPSPPLWYSLPPSPPLRSLSLIPFRHRARTVEARSTRVHCGS